MLYFEAEVGSKLTNSSLCPLRITLPPMRGVIDASYDGSNGQEFREGLTFCISAPVCQTI